MKYTLRGMAVVCKEVKDAIVGGAKSLVEDPLPALVGASVITFFGGEVLGGLGAKHGDALMGYSGLALFVGTPLAWAGYAGIKALNAKGREAEAAHRRQTELGS